MPSSSCSASYGHNSHGINVQNLRGLAPSSVYPTSTTLPGGMRPEHAWSKEVERSRKEGEFSGQLATRLRESNKAAQVVAEVHVAEGVGRVQAALRVKLGQIQLQTHSLQDAVVLVKTELGKLSRAQQRLSTLHTHLQDKLVVNRGRQQARLMRPLRERTCDDVNRSLARQEAVLINLMQKLQRGSALVAVDIGKLQDVYQKLATSLKDKLATQRVDEAVLHVPARPGSAEQAPVKDLLATVLNSNAPNKANAKEATGHDSTGVSSNVARTALFGYAKATCSGLYPSMWHKQTEQLVTEAQQLVTDSSRLRNGVKQVLQECLSTCQAASRQVDAALATKLLAAGELRNELTQQLAHVQGEIEVAVEHRETLKESLQAKQSPLQQLEARLALRVNRPAAEAVDDEVQAALAAEATQLNAVSNQLHARVDATSQQICQLNAVSAALLQHISDKDTTLSLEEKVALMDGRKIAAVPPSPTVLSVASSVVSGYSALGESASQIGAAASRAGSVACASRLGGHAGGPGSCAGSATSSALVRIAALEKELAVAKSESAQLRALVGGSGRA